jgi:hypothetical protein
MQVARDGSSVRTLHDVRRADDPFVLGCPNRALPGAHLVVNNVTYADELVCGFV